VPVSLSAGPFKFNLKSAGRRRLAQSETTGGGLRAPKQPPPRLGVRRPVNLKSIRVMIAINAEPFAVVDYSLVPVEFTGTGKPQAAGRRRT
jgi:hypothetical protein